MSLAAVLRWAYWGKRAETGEVSNYVAKLIFQRYICKKNVLWGLNIALVKVSKPFLGCKVF